MITSIRYMGAPLYKLADIQKECGHTSGNWGVGHLVDNGQNVRVMAYPSKHGERSARFVTNEALALLMKKAGKKGPVTYDHQPVSLKYNDPQESSILDGGKHLNELEFKEPQDADDFLDNFIVQVEKLRSKLKTVVRVNQRSGMIGIPDDSSDNNDKMRNWIKEAVLKHCKGKANLGHTSVSMEYHRLYNKFTSTYGISLEVLNAYDRDFGGVGVSASIIDTAERHGMLEGLYIVATRMYSQKESSDLANILRKIRGGS